MMTLTPWLSIDELQHLVQRSDQQGRFLLNDTSSLDVDVLAAGVNVLGNVPVR